MSAREGLVRLHVTPFTSDLYHSLIPPRVAAAVQNLSFHSIQTFPERNYGYVDLPAMEAEKIKRKLNGAIIKGQKIKVETARPLKRRPDSDVAETEGHPPGHATETRSSKRLRSGGQSVQVIAGREISPDRKVKRSWTEPKKDKSQKPSGHQTLRPKSKYSSNEELLFRTTVPPNKTSTAGQGDEKKNKKKAKTTLVHEFENTTKYPAFLRQRESGAEETGTIRYVDGKGWVDEAGTVVEDEPVNVSRKRQAAGRGLEQAGKSASAMQESSCSPDYASQNDADGPPLETIEAQETLSASSSVAPDSQPGNKQDGPTRSASPGTQMRASPPHLHPLEAIFKKPRKPLSQDVPKPSLELQTSFSFFGASGEPDIDIPGTPFSSQDVRRRGIRSAAPTPDTAHPSRFNSYGTPDDDDREGLSEPGSDYDEDGGDDEDDNEGNQPEQPQPAPSRDNTGTSKAGKAVPQSEFEKEFWENRGENNRAWRQRRRAVMKEKRQQEKRARVRQRW